MPSNQSNTVKASRHGRYRKILLDPQSLLPIAKPLEAIFQELNQQRHDGLLDDAEFVSFGLITLLACRRPDAFQQYKSRKLAATETPKTASTNFMLADLWQLLCLHKLPVGHYQTLLDQKISVYKWLSSIRFRGIPDAAHSALLQWLKKKYPLTLHFHVPSATEVFALQKRGGRCISFFINAEEITELHHERDTLSFTIHDLIHAHEFYAQPERAQQQIGFYHWLDNIQHNPQLIKLLTESDEFLKRWEYVMSDMNSYGGHLLKTLHAAITSYEKSIHAPAGEGERLWNNVVESSDLETQAKHLFRKINSEEWGDADFLQLETVLEKRFQLANQ